MLPQLLLSLFLGTQFVAGSVILQKDAESILPALDLPVGSAVEPERWSYDNCGSPDDIVEIKSIEISPEPPKPGQNLTITAKGTVKQTLEDGAYADVLVKLGLIKLLQKRFDICEEANANATIQCPVEPGDYTLVQNIELPKEIPPAKFSIAVRAYNNDDADAACVNIKVDFTPHRRGLW